MRIEHWVYTIPLRLRPLFHRNRLDAELDEELAITSTGRSKQICWRRWDCSGCFLTSLRSERRRWAFALRSAPERAHVLRLALFGLLLGLAASARSVKLIESMLYGTRPFDPAVFAAVSAMLLVVAALACAMPAWRASRLDPMLALGTE